MNNADTLKNDKKGWSNKDEQQPVSSSRQRTYDTRKKNVDSMISGGEKQDKPNSSIESIIEKFRKRLFSRGGKGIIGLGRQFKIFDDNNSQTLQLDEFTKACKDFKIDITSNEIKVLFNYFDRDGSGSVDYNEFLRQVRGEMNDFRKGLVLKAFNKLDVDSSGIVEINDLKYVFNVKNNPDVRSGKKTEEEVYGEFIETFEMHHNINKGSRDRRVTKEEFIEYYNNISCSIDDDAYFELMMTNAWKLNAPTIRVKSSASPSNAGKSNRPTDNIKAPYGTQSTYQSSSTRAKPDAAGVYLKKLRKKISARGTRGIFGLRRTFLIYEEKDTRTLRSDSFIQIIENYRLGLNPDEASVLFKAFDSNNSGDIDYEEFLRGIVGEMNDFRKNLVKKAFSILDKDRSGTLEPSDLKDTYNPKKHPDVISGKKTENEVLAEYLDNFEYHFGLLVSKVLFNI